MTWQLGLQRRSRRLVPNLANVALILEHDEAWAQAVYWDDFAGKIVKEKRPSLAVAELSRSRYWEDSDTDAVRVWLESTYAKGVAIPADVIYHAIDHVARKRTKHPIRDWLDGLTWDGKPRVASWLTEHLKVDPAPYVAEVGKRWLISAVARVYDPGCQVDYVLIFEGAQRAGKSTALRTLCGNPDWYLESGIELASKDAYHAIAHKWIVEMAELDSMSRAEISRVKAFLTSRVDTYRPAYGRATINQPRVCVFAGTTNESVYLRDDTGGGRFWPVRVGISQEKPIDRDKLEAARDQLWAEAVHMYRCGERVYLNDEKLIEMLLLEQENRRVSDPWEDRIQEHLLDPELTKTGVTIHEILMGAVGFEKNVQVDRSHQNRAGSILSRFGWECRQIRQRDQRIMRIWKPKAAWCVEVGDADRNHTVTSIDVNSSV